MPHTDPALKKLSRLYVDRPLEVGQTFALSPGQGHYLRSVMRREAGETVRLFNGVDGEWLARLTAIDKKAVTVTPETQIIPQPIAPSALHLLFAPIKKTRLDFLVEKAVELGATHLRPVITTNTENRHINAERMQSQVVEAAEQCERLDMPQCLPSIALQTALTAWPTEIKVLACLERRDAMTIGQACPGHSPCAVLIGPEGGFTEDEANWLLDRPFIVPVTLGPRILRSETAVCAALAVLSQRSAR